jgi:hypothetical protein
MNKPKVVSSWTRSTEAGEIESQVVQEDSGRIYSRYRFPRNGDYWTNEPGNPYTRQIARLAAELAEVKADMVVLAVRAALAAGQRDRLREAVETIEAGLLALSEHPDYRPILPYLNAARATLEATAEEGGYTTPTLCMDCGKAPPVSGEDYCLLCLDSIDVQMQVDRDRE